MAQMAVVVYIWTDIAQRAVVVYIWSEMAHIAVLLYTLQYIPCFSDYKGWRGPAFSAITQIIPYYDTW